MDLPRTSMHSVTDESSVPNTVMYKIWRLQEDEVDKLHYRGQYLPMSEIVVGGIFKICAVYSDLALALSILKIVLMTNLSEK